MIDLIQQLQIVQTNIEVGRNRRRTNDVKRAGKETAVSVETLALACQAMWELLSERLGVTDEELIARIREIDFRDGKLDGRISRGLAECPQCNRANATDRSRCLYCGCELPASTF